MSINWCPLQTESDMARLGIRKEDLNLEAQQLAESTRALARVESAQILSKKFITRDRVKQRMIKGHEEYLDKVSRWVMGPVIAGDSRCLSSSLLFVIILFLPPPPFLSSPGPVISGFPVGSKKLADHLSSLTSRPMTSGSMR